MERKSFLKSLGLLSLAVVMPKFLFGKENPKIQSGSFSKECKSNDWNIRKHYIRKYHDTGIVELEVTDGIKETYIYEDNKVRHASLIYVDLYDQVHLYVTDNVNKPRHYIKDDKGNFMFNEELPSEKCSHPL